MLLIHCSHPENLWYLVKFKLGRLHYTLWSNIAASPYLSWKGNSSKAPYMERRGQLSLCAFLQPLLPGALSPAAKIAWLTPGEVATEQQHRAVSPIIFRRDPAVTSRTTFPFLWTSARMVPAQTLLCFTSVQVVAGQKKNNENSWSF